MGLATLLAELVLGATFVVAGVAKLRDGPNWPRQANDLGVATWVARTVPYVEITIGVVLATGLVSPWAAVAAVGVLVAFTFVIAQRLLDGTRPPCACFGSASDKPLGARHVVRNVLLIGLGAIAIVGA